MITLFLMCLKNIFIAEMFCLFNSRKYTQSRNPTLVQGEGGGGAGLVDGVPPLSF